MLSFFTGRERRQYRPEGLDEARVDQLFDLMESIVLTATKGALVKLVTDIEPDELDTEVDKAYDNLFTDPFAKLITEWQLAGDQKAALLNTTHEIFVSAARRWHAGRFDLGERLHQICRAAQAGSWDFTKLDAQSAIRVVGADGSRQLSVLSEDEEKLLRRALEPQK